ncbi:tetratricopeptide repeat protein [Fontivita pretiosa]|uniref:tetratricopeptide repeat protein n=1 Tax=Fontivita pretiosa TaxID=2989684 RepID=UPI003D171485
MNTSHSKYRSPPGACCALLSIAILLATGCASGNKSQATSKADTRDARRQQVEDEFDRGARRQPSARTLYAMARILVAKGRDRDAIYLLNRTVQQYPKFAPAYNEMAGIYLRSDRVNDAIEVLSMGLKHAPHDSVMRNNLGLCWLVKQEYARAAGEFKIAADAAPDNAVYRANHALALGMLGRSDEAAKVYDGVISDVSIEHNLSVLARARHLRPGAATTAPSAVSMSRGGGEG